MNKRILYSLSLLTIALTSCGGKGQSSNISSTSTSVSSETSSSTTSSSSEDKPKTLLLNHDNMPSLVNERDTFSMKVTMANNSDFIFNYVNVSANNNGHITLKDGGYLANLDALPGIININANFTGGELKYYYGYSIADANCVNLFNNTDYQNDTDYSYIRLEAVGQVEIKDISFTVSYQPDLSYQYVKAFEDDHETIREIQEFKIGQVVDASSFIKPSPVYYEEQELTFLGYALENYEEVVTSFNMEDHPMFLYPVFQDVQRFSWDHDSLNHTYTSIKAGVRPVKEVIGEKFGRYSADFFVNNTSTTGIGIIWNLIIPETSYPYADGCQYYYFHLNPNNGGCQISKVDNGVYTALKTYTVTTNAYWNAYWSNWNAKGRSEPLFFTMTAEFTASAVSLYLNDACLGSYDVSSNLGLFNSTVVGIRTNVAGNDAMNFHFDNLVKSENGFNQFGDGSFVSSMNNISTIVPGYNYNHVRFETDMTITSTTSNARSGLMIRAYRPTNESVATNWTHQSGYYMHHNVTANANFTCTSIYDNTYAKRPDGGTGNIGSKTYNESTTGALGQYYKDNALFYTGATPSFTVRIGFELSNSHIAIYVNGEMIYENKTASNLSYFDALPNNTGIGLVAGTPGVIFSNMEVTNLDA